MGVFILIKVEFVTHLCLKHSHTLFISSRSFLLLPTIISDSVLLWRNKLYKILLNLPSVTYFPLDAINCTNIYNNMITATLAKSERD